jgi:RNA polymerase sigma-54 factor
MRYFFTPGYSAQSAGGESVSNRAVMRRIEELVKAEDKRKPLSDSAVAKMLEAEGLEVARRTVAKYRERLGVPGSKQRKQY